MSTVEQRLKDMGITLPSPPAPAANYVPYVVTGNLVFVAGQVPFDTNGKIAHTGKVGAGATLEQAQAAAKLCAINILAQVRAAAGDLEKVVRCVKLGGFVACVPDFTDHPKVINGASDLIVAALGDRGKHARFAVGAPSLPLNSTVEVDAVFEIA